MSRGNLNLRAAYLHNLADAFSSVGVILAGAMQSVVRHLLDRRGHHARHRRLHPLAEPRDDAPLDSHPHGGRPGRRRSGRAGRRVAVDSEGVVEIHHLHVWELDEHIARWKPTWSWTRSTCPAGPRSSRKSSCVSASGFGSNIRPSSSKSLGRSRLPAVPAGGAASLLAMCGTRCRQLPGPITSMLELSIAMRCGSATSVPLLFKFAGCIGRFNRWCCIVCASKLLAVLLAKTSDYEAASWHQATICRTHSAASATVSSTPFWAA